MLENFSHQLYDILTENSFKYNTRIADFMFVYRGKLLHCTTMLVKRVTSCHSTRGTC